MSSHLSQKSPVIIFCDLQSAVIGSDRSIQRFKIPKRRNQSPEQGGIGYRRERVHSSVDPQIELRTKGETNVRVSQVLELNYAGWKSIRMANCCCN